MQAQIAELNSQQVFRGLSRVITQDEIKLYLSLAPSHPFSLPGKGVCGEPTKKIMRLLLITDFYLPDVLLHCTLIKSRPGVLQMG